MTNFQGGEMAKTWKPTVAGILNIIGGTLSIFWLIGIIIAISTLGNLPFLESFVPPAEVPFIYSVLNTALILLAVLAVFHVVFPIIGGIYALQRRKWGWALAGSIVNIVGTAILGILSTIFIALAKDEFE
jgi:hypothetical protein